MNFTENTEKKIYFISSLIYRIDKFYNCVNFLEKLPDNVVATIFGLNKISKINLPLSLIENLQLLILYLRMCGGLDLEIRKKEDKFFLINFDTVIEEISNFEYKYRDELLSKTIDNFSEAETDRKLKDFLI